jgi:aryl-alcohol dehydrogenase-like predicted oxidoreductase
VRRQAASAGLQPVSPRRARWALGLAALGRPAYITTVRVGGAAERSVEVLRANTFDVLDVAAAAGVDWVDAARSYGRAEEFLGAWFASRRPDPAPTVSSKWGYRYVGNWEIDADVHEVKEHTLPRFRQQWAETSALLPGLVGLYQIHSLTVDSPVLDDPELLGSLAGLPESGVAVGFSTSGPRQADTIRRAIDVAVDGRPLFSGVQSTWNLFEPSAGSALAEASEAGLTVLVKEALANGRLVTDAPSELQDLARRHEAGVDAVALAAAAAQPWADRVILGPADPAQLAANLQADLVQLSGDDLDALAESAEPTADYWATRSALPWH